MIKGLVDGRVLEHRHGFEPWLHYDVTRSPGSELPAKCVLTHIKGDWSEFSKSLGLSPWSKHYQCCPYCPCSKDTMFLDDTGLGFGGIGYCERSDDDYEQACRKCEIRVQVGTRELQRQILSNLVYDLNGKSAHGRVCADDMVFLGLKRGDRLDPSPHLVNPNMFESAEPPFEAVFWRRHCDNRRRCTDWVMHRSPVFDLALGTSPTRTLAIDSLHTVYLGPCLRWTGATLMRIMHANPWRVPGHQRLARLELEMLQWFDQEGVPADRRVRRLTEKMMPAEADDPHPGGAMKLKAAEARIVMGFALFSLKSRVEDVSFGHSLLQAGLALAEWFQVTDTPRVRLTVDEYQALVDSSHRLRVYCAKALVEPAPKSHAIAHLSIRTVCQSRGRPCP